MKGKGKRNNHQERKKGIHDKLGWLVLAQMEKESYHWKLLLLSEKPFKK